MIILLKNRLKNIIWHSSSITKSYKTINTRHVLNINNYNKLCLASLVLAGLATYSLETLVKPGHSLTFCTGQARGGFPNFYPLATPVKAQLVARLLGRTLTPVNPSLTGHHCNILTFLSVTSKHNLYCDL